VDLVFNILSMVLLLLGSCFALVGGLGVLRFPDFFSRLHGGGITDTLGAGLIILGLVFQAVKVGLAENPESTAWLVTVKLMMILFFLFITSPTGCHALARAALADGVKPLVTEEEELPRP
jgi:multicomponent Na+:H+ antiporter subunit G